MNRAFWMGSFVVAMWSSAAIAQSTLPSDFSVDQPTIPEREFSISKFGAVGDGRRLIPRRMRGQFPPAKKPAGERGCAAGEIPHRAGSAGK